MTPTLSPNTQAILLLTAPLIHGRTTASPDLLSPGDYKRLAKRLHELGQQPADLIESGADTILRACATVVDKGRLERLLGRGFAMSQAVEQWQARAIWIVSRADHTYPGRFKTRLRENAPAILYGCGDVGLLNTGGLAVVGSRHVSDELTDYARDVGRSAAHAGRTLVSGGAKGIDLAAMNGALEGGGSACGVVAAGLGKLVTHREHRDLLLEGRLALVSPYDPTAGFNVGHAMQRNKLIYALADAALIVSSDEGKGGTWAGAVEQLDKLEFVPLYVRSTGETMKGLRALERKGAYPWPDPDDVPSFDKVFDPEPQSSGSSAQFDLMLTERNALEYAGAPRTRSGSHDAASKSASADGAPGLPPVVEQPIAASSTARATLIADAPEGCKSTSRPVDVIPADRLFSTVRSVMSELLHTPKGEAEIGTELGVSSVQARKWLRRLQDEGVVERQGRPLRYRLKDG